MTPLRAPLNTGAQPLLATGSIAAAHHTQACSGHRPFGPSIDLDTKCTDHCHLVAYVCSFMLAACLLQLLWLGKCDSRLQLYPASSHVCNMG